MKKLLFIFVLFIFINVNALEEVSFDRCVDGDTAWLKVGDISYKYRFLAIDTPETLHPTKDGGILGKTASEYTCNLLKSATKLEIEYDENSTKTDKYNRELVWLFVDNKLIQEELVENGYAKIEYVYGDYKYLDILEEKENIAKEERIGIWGNIYKVTFIYEDKKEVFEVIEGTNVEPLKIDEESFLGWYVDDNAFDFKTIIDKDIILIAKYKKDPILLRLIFLALILIILYFIDRKKFNTITKKIKKTLVE
ncbi:MAG: thermonuclease family protein [Bacilli bacterium]|nr:thermonuclease family protein [Bacilli bacterium]MDD4623888.1 thermonuclease family protein [Bacilli bacterium]